MDIHDTAARGFDLGTEAYERSRPSYPADAISFLLEKLRVERGSRVVELGAGTGKFTRLLADSGAGVVAVEPVAGMRRTFQELLPDVDVMEGSAEAIPLPDASADAVVAAQAFHWFRGDEALAEIHRVLRPDRGLGLIWNVRDESVDWVGRLSEVINWHESGVPRYWKGEWRAAFERTDLFTPLEDAHFQYDQEIDSSVLESRVLSISYIAALPREEQETVVQQVRDLVATHPQLAGRERFVLPYRTDIYWCSARS